MMTSKTAFLRVLVLMPLLSGWAVSGIAAPHADTGRPELLDPIPGSDRARVSIPLPGFIQGRRNEIFVPRLRLAQTNLQPVDESLTAEQAYAMGVNYGFGRNGYPKDYNMAARLYKQAARRGHLKATYNLALAYRKGRGVRRNYSETIRLYRLAITKGHKGSMNNMGFMYENGYGVARNNQQALRYYRMAADRGHKLGRENIARLRRSMAGSGTRTGSTSPSDKLRPFDRSLSSSQAFRLAIKYSFGRDGYPRDFRISARLNNQAARQGHSGAMYNLALAYRNGKGVPRNYYEAVRLYRLAIAKNHAGALNNLGYMYEKGYGVRKDSRRALRYYQRARDGGSPSGRRNFARLNPILNSGGGGGSGNQDGPPPFDRNLGPSAAYSLGRDYYYARNGRRRDYYAAAQLYHQAARSGHSRAQYNLAISYALGKGVTKSYYKALR